MSQRLYLASAIGFLGALFLSAAPAAAQCTAPDAFEPNDDCTTAAVLAPGLHAGLHSQGPAAPGGTDLDFYRVDVGPGESLEVTALFQSHASADLDLFLYDALSATCGDRSTALAASTSSGDGERVHYTNATTASQQLIIEVGPKSGASVICAEYALDVQVGLDRCAGPDDTFAPNDDCASASVLAGSGDWTDLFVSQAAPDYFRVTLQPGEQLHAAIEYDSAQSELGLELFADSTCTNRVRSAGYGGRDDVSWENESATAVTMTLRVYVQQGERCNDYSLSLSVGPDPCVAPVDDSFAPNDTCATAAVLVPGTYADLFVSGAAPDSFKILVPANEVLSVDVIYPRDVNGSLGMGLFSDENCSVGVDNDYYGGEISVTTGSSSPVDREYWLKVFTMLPNECNTYELTVSLSDDPCVTAVDDPFDPSSDCSAPVALLPGAYVDLLCRDGEPDYYEVVLQPGEQLDAMLSYSRANGESVKLLIQDVGCNSTLDYGGTSDGARAQYSNAGSSPLSVVVSVELQSSSSGSCASYDLILDVRPDPCLVTPDDLFDDNDDCASAAILNQGLHEDLFVHKLDPDYYLVSVELGETLVVTMDYDTPAADVRMRLYQQVPVNGGACGDGGSYEVQGYGSNGSKTLTWLNGIETGDYVLEIEIGPWSSSDCTMYAMSVAGGGAPLATPLCFGDASDEGGRVPTNCPCGNLSEPGSGQGCLNSRGVGAVLRASGSNSVAADNLRFTVEGAIPKQSGIVLQGSALTPYPFKDGILCVGNQALHIERIRIDAAGSGSTATSIATQGGITEPGTTRYYQAWYRDPVLSPCGTGSNLTQGLRVDWN